MAGIGKFEESKRPIRKEDLKIIRDNLSTGDHMIWWVEKWDIYKSGKKVNVEITGVYPHFATGVDKKGRRYSHTYVEIEMEWRRENGKSQSS